MDHDGSPVEGLGVMPPRRTSTGHPVKDYSLERFRTHLHYSLERIRLLLERIRLLAGGRSKPELLGNVWPHSFQSHKRIRRGEKGNFQNRRQPILKIPRPDEFVYGLERMRPGFFEHLAREDANLFSRYESV